MSETAKDLLFAFLALRQNAVDSEALMEILTDWAESQDLTLPDLLVREQALHEQARQTLGERLDDTLNHDGGDADESLCFLLRQAFREENRTAIQAFLNRTFVVPQADVDEAHSKGGAPGARFESVEMFAQGGLGRIWRAEDPTLRRTIAMKDLKPELAGNETARKRFLREARVTGQLQHPNIVPIYELIPSTNGSSPSYTMRLIQGLTLDEAIARSHGDKDQDPEHPITLRTLLEAFIDVCQAVGYAHSRGVIHRDLKPANIILGTYGEVMLLDWGLAKLVDAEEDDVEVDAEPIADGDDDVETKVGQVVGTPAYMAPEQAAGNVPEIDSRTDIYGLGAILFHIVTGHEPHQRRPGETIAESITRIAKEPAPRPRSIKAGVSSELDAITSTAMAFDGNKRYSSAMALSCDVRHALAGDPVSVYREPLSRRFARWALRHRLLTQIFAVLTLLVICIASTIATQSWENRSTLLKLQMMTLQNQAHELAAAMRSKVRQEINNVRMGAELASVQKALQDHKTSGSVNATTRAIVIKQLRQILAAEPGLLETEVIDPEGNEILRANFTMTTDSRVATAPPQSLRQLGFREDVATALKLQPGEVHVQQTRFADPEDPTARRPGVVVATPIYLGDSETPSGVFVTFLDYFLIFKELCNRDPKQTAYLTTLEGDYFFAFIPERDAELPKGNIATHYTSVGELLDKPEANKTLEVFRSNDGNEMIFGRFVYLPKVSEKDAIGLFLTYPRSAVVSQSQVLSLELVIGLSAIVLIAIALALFFSRSMTRLAQSSV
ncbi:Serine/threonine-protein kinase PknD [Planctomycetes bacterium Pan216]|uniref:Serine/threonine-protein kinase PknD n=1 Tax=Kolteria novifilia TaxID=2527975 RepID=A0A518B3H3_9BACT|nr:Serine/threonine-protein kinase PknD [Planctomycetes bacterium Pan216]